MDNMFNISSTANAMSMLKKTLDPLGIKPWHGKNPRKTKGMMFQHAMFDAEVTWANQGHLVPLAEPFLFGAAIVVQYRPRKL